MSGVLPPGIHYTREKGTETIASLEVRTRLLKKEIQRKANVAHKRLKRLERNNLTDLPAYQQWVKDGKVRFGVRGKNYNELQAELGRLNRFLDSKTSLVRQANKYMKDIASYTGVKYSSVKELPHKLKNFFSISGKVEEYLRNVEGSASAIGYHKLWEVVNEVVQEEEIDLADSRLDSDKLMEKVIDLIQEQYLLDWMKEETYGEWFRV